MISKRTHPIANDTSRNLGQKPNRDQVAYHTGAQLQRRCQKHRQQCPLVTPQWQKEYSRTRTTSERIPRNDSKISISPLAPAGLGSKSEHILTNGAHVRNKGGAYHTQASKGMVTWKQPSDRETSWYLHRLASTDTYYPPWAVIGAVQRKVCLTAAHTSTSGTC